MPGRLYPPSDHRTQLSEPALAEMPGPSTLPRGNEVQMPLARVVADRRVGVDKAGGRQEEDQGQKRDGEEEERGMGPKSVREG